MATTFPKESPNLGLEEEGGGRGGRGGEGGREEEEVTSYNFTGECC